MKVFLGDQKKIEALFDVYDIKRGDQAVNVAPSIKAIDPLHVEQIFLLGGDWLYAPHLKEIAEIGIDRSKVLLGTEPDRIHGALYPSGASCPAIGYKAIYHDVFERPWYAYPMVVAAAVCVRMGIPAFHAIEFGVFTGAGLRNMASLAKFITATIGVGINVLGFDTGAGLPSVADWRDHPELWSTGGLACPDVEEIRRSLPPHAKLIVGDIKQTLAAALQSNLSAASPLGFVALDVDTYSSSVDALKVFEQPADKLLPVVPMYVDDANVNISQTRFAGEGLAISEFNEANHLRKIDQKIVRTDRPQMPWHHTMYFAHVFDHEMRAKSGPINLIGLNHFYF